MSEPCRVQAALFASRWPENLLPAITSLRAAHPTMRLVLGGPDLGKGRSALPVDDYVPAETPADLITHLWQSSGDHILAVGDTVVAPPAFLDRAIAAIEDDMRVATVSFLSNSAGHLSFPGRNAPSLRGVDGTDEAVVTTRLRLKSPQAVLAPIPLPGGAAVLISSYALGAVGLTAVHRHISLDATLAEFSLRARRRGFVDLLDAGTYITRPAGISSAAEQADRTAAVERTAVLTRYPYFAGFLASELASTTSPLALAHATARAKVTGISVVIEAHSLGPLEMGTQVQTLALIRALAQSADVTRVGVAVAAPPPAYAQNVLRMSKVEPRITAPDDFSTFGSVDIVHRTYQPDAVNVDAWRRVAARTVVTVQDLIAYQVGAYHQSGADWLAYRDSMQRATRAADGIVVVSADTAAQLSREAFPIDRPRVFVVPNGTDHLTGAESARMPDVLAIRQASDDEFVLMIGTDYAHKNRDLGIAAWKLLRERGWRHTLVLAGARVGHGSSRVEEAGAGVIDPDVLVLPDVPTDERNWLLRHASVLLYPTSSEGFGLVPYEAASFGTPTVAIPFGPLREVNAELPVWSADWTASSLASAAESLLRDPGVAREQVAATIAAGTSYTWEYTAERLVDAYRTLLGWPTRS